MFFKNWIKYGISTVIGSGLIYIGYLTVYLFFKKRKYAHIPGPKGKGLFGFYFGILPEALCNISKGVMFPVYIQKCFEKYGPIFMVQMFDRFVIYTLDPDTIKDGLIIKNFIKHSKLYKQVGFPYNERFLGQGLLTETRPEIWKHRRALFQPGFSKKVLMNYTIDFDAKADRLIERLRKLTYEKEYFDLRMELKNSVLEIIGEVLFGMHLDCLNDSYNEFNKNVTDALSGMAQVFKNPLTQLKSNTSFTKASKFLRQTGKEQILKRIRALENNEHVPNDILSIVLSSYFADNDSFELESMVDDFVSFFVAGLETTSSALSFCFMELGRNPQVLEKLKDEIDRVVGSKAKITYEELENLEYTGYVFKETLRLWPVAPSLNRLILEDIEIDGVKIPKNSEISFSTYCAHRNPKYYENPNSFIPERFKIDPVTKRNSIHPYTYFPFSLGARNCLGQNFATIESKMIIAKIVQNFELILKPSQSFDVEYMMNLRHKDGIYCKLNVRN